MPQHQPAFRDFGGSPFTLPKWGNAPDISTPPYIPPGQSSGQLPDYLMPYGGGAGPGVGGDSPSGFNPYIKGFDVAKGLTNAYLGFQNLQLGRDQFNTQKSIFNTNLANSALTTNAAIEDQTRSRVAGSGRFDRNTPEGRAQLAAEIERITAPRRVSGRAIV